MEEPFYYGVDFGWDMAQVSRYDFRSRQPESVSFSGGQQEVLMPIALCRRQENGEWYAGQDALRMAARSGNILVNGLLEKLMREETVDFTEVRVSAEELVEIYIRSLLELFRHCYGTVEVTRMVITLPDGAAKVQPVMEKILSRLGLAQEKIVFLSHSECFMYYCVNTQQSLWMNDVALFSCDEESFCFERLSAAKGKQPIVVQSELADLSKEYMECDLRNQPAARKAYWFLNQAQERLKGQQISTIYVTGTGFMGGWADDVLRGLCDGRRVFFGQNLYTKGACEAARMLSDGSAREYLFLSGDMIRESIYLKVFRDSREDYVEMVHAGMNYQDAKFSCRIILDNTGEIEFLVHSAKKREPVHEMMILDHPLRKENKTTRLELTLQYIDGRTPVVQIRDMGFAGTKSTRRIWEQRI